MQYEEIASRQERLGQLNGMIDKYLVQLSRQRVALVLIGCLLVLAVVVIVSQRRIVRLRESRSTMTDLFSSDISRAAERVENEQIEVSTIVADEMGKTSQYEDASSSFASRLRDVLQTHLSDPQLDVDMIATHMGMSRANLYRKVKSLTGQSAVELIRESRLKRAHTMLMQNDKTVSEIAYAVGFSSPAYFTKCYKEYYGHTPKNSKNQS